MGKKNIAIFQIQIWSYKTEVLVFWAGWKSTVKIKRYASH